MLAGAVSVAHAQPDRLAPKEVTVPTPPGLTVTFNLNGVHLTWGSVPLATKYLVWRLPSANMRDSSLMGEIAQGARLAIVDSGVATPKVYHVFAVLANGMRSQAASVQYLPPNPLVVPGATNFTGVSQANGVQLSWTEAPVAVEYQLWRILKGQRDSTFVAMTRGGHGNTSFFDQNSLPAVYKLHTRYVAGLEGPVAVVQVPSTGKP